MPCNDGMLDGVEATGGWLALSTSASFGNEVDEEAAAAAAAGLPHAGLDAFSLAGCCVMMAGAGAGEGGG